MGKKKSDAAVKVPDLQTKADKQAPRAKGKTGKKKK